MSFEKNIRHQGLSFRLHSLTQSFGRKFDSIQKITRKLRLLDPSSSMTPRLLRKMAKWVQQLSSLQAQEKKILSAICKIEERHKNRRAGKLVRFVQQAPAPDMAAQTKKKNRFWLLFLLLLILTENNKPRPVALFTPRNG